MKQFKVFFILTTFTLLLTACPQATTPPITPEPQPPVTPDPTTFPVTAITGTLSNWTAGEAYATLTSGYSVGSPIEEGADEVTFGAPAYPTALSADGTFAVQLTAPQSAELTTLTCGDKTYPLGFLLLAAVSSVPEPRQSDEFLGAYTLGPAGSLTTDAIWVYSAAALELDASCTLPGSSSPAAVKLALLPGWNQAVLTQGEPVRLESGAIPTSFIWSQF